MLVKKEWLSIAMMVAFAGGFYLLMQDYEGDAILFPMVMVILMLCLAVIKAITELFRMRTPLLDQSRAQSPAPYPLARIAFVLLAMVAYIWFIEDLGFYTCAFLFFFVTTLVIQGSERTPKVIAVRFVTCFAFITFLYVLFSIILKVQLPKGILL